MRLPRIAMLACAAAFAFAAPRPKLVVVVSVDQLAASLVERWGPEWTGGLARLGREGVAFTQTYHAHGYTETGPGHAVLLSGRHPASTGIVENSWLDRGTGRRVYCVEDSAAWNFSKEAPPGMSPAQFRGTTLGGWLKAQVPGSRVFSLTGKDRSAILMAGPQADGVFWFENDAGFTSSTYYGSELPPWMVAYDRALMRRLGRTSWTWTASGPLGPDTPRARWTINGEVVDAGLPRVLKKASQPWTRSLWEAWKASPFLDEEVLKAATHLMTTQRLGRGQGTDLLLVGLSATDKIGHEFGNGGPEMKDQLRRLDLQLDRFLKAVRRRDPGAWVVLTADHGGLDLPERLAATMPQAKRLDPAGWLNALRARLKARFNLQGDPLRKGSAPLRLYLNDAVLGTVGETRADMLKAVAEEARKMPEVLEVATAAELEAMPLPSAARPEALTVKERLRLSYAPGRSPDLLLAFQPYVVTEGPPDEAVATHRGPHDYDRRVPLVFWGPWKQARRDEPVATVDLAATLAWELGLTPTEPLDGRPLLLQAR